MPETERPIVCVEVAVRNEAGGRDQVMKDRNLPSNTTWMCVWGGEFLLEVFLIYVPLVACLQDYPENC